MPFVIYIFTIFSFAIGLAEFVPIGLVEVMAGGLQTEPEHIGKIVTVYALGATLSALVLTALTNGLSRKTVMLATMVVFSAGSLITAFAGSLGMMIAARFTAGLGHGLFLAVASSTAARLAGKARAGSAVAVVFSGFTLAMAFGVPVSTYLGNVIDWRWVLGAIALFGAIGFVGLGIGMKDPIKSEQTVSAVHNLKLLLNPQLLKAASVTVFAYSGAFAAYTYIAAFIAQVTFEGNEMMTVYMLLFGMFAVLGNIIGGKLTDRLGIRTANIALVGLLIAVTALISLIGTSPFVLKILVAVLGFLTFSIVPSLQAALIQTAYKQGGNADSVASGLNIAGFNSGIALGSAVGGIIMQTFGVTYVGFGGAALSAIGLTLFLLLNRNTAA